MRKLLVFTIVLALAVPLAHLSSPIVKADDASVSRNVLLELFTATWCSGCPYADAAGEKLKTEYGGRVSLLQYHVEDHFGTPETAARGELFDLADSGIPAMWVDGQGSEVGAQSENAAYSAYKSLVDARLSANSPLELLIADANQSAGIIKINVDVQGTTSLQHSEFAIRFVLYENELLYDEPQPNTIYNYVVRDIEEQNVTKSSLPITLTQNFTFNSSWVFDNMGVVVYAQVGDTGEVLQSHSLIFGIKDEDGDGLPDEWELQKLNTLLYGPEDDPDGDNITNWDEYLNLTDPLVKDIDGSADNYLWLLFAVVLIVIIVIIGALGFRSKLKKGKGG